MVDISRKAQELAVSSDYLSPISAQLPANASLNKSESKTSTLGYVRGQDQEEGKKKAQHPHHILSQQLAGASSSRSLVMRSSNLQSTTAGNDHSASHRTLPVAEQAQSKQAGGATSIMAPSRNAKVLQFKGKRKMRDMSTILYDQIDSKMIKTIKRKRSALALKSKFDGQ